MSLKRQLLIDTALDLFYQHGINSMGINEVLSASGVAKRTLYAHFQSKEALILAALQQRHDIFCTWLEQQLAGVQSNAELIQRLFSALARWFENQESVLGTFRGCFFINTSAEFCDIDSEIVRFCRFHKAHVRHIIASHLSDPSSPLLDAICIMKEGVIVTAHLGGDSKTLTTQCIETLTAQH